jgi:peptide/nickel transport system substrate-binding protein
MTDRIGFRCFFIALVCLFLSACSGEKPGRAKPGGDANPAGSQAAAESPAADASTPIAAAPSEGSTASTPAADSNADSKTISPITPPATLAELDKHVEWEDKPILSPLKLLAEDLAKHPPVVTVPQALALKNDSPENNTKILSALGRLPEQGQQPDGNARITRHLLGEVNNTNPIMIDSVQEFDLVPLIQFQLFTFDWNLIPFADAAAVEKWQTSKDHMCDKIIMRRDLTWSDGKPITAQDVAFSFRAIMNLKIPVPAMRSTCEHLADVVAYDDYTVVVFHKQPLATSDWNLQWSIIPKHVYEPLYAKLDTMSWDNLQRLPEFQESENRPVTGGQYDLVSRTRGDEIVCKRRESWYMHDGKQVRDKPFFEEVRFRIITDPNTARLALMSGEIDDFEIPQEQWATQTVGADFYAKNTKAYGVEWLYWFFGYNVNSPAAPFFKDLRVRQAMAYAFDYREMLDKYLYGMSEPCAGISHPTAWFAPKPPLTPYHQDLDKAEKLLDEAGWADSDGDGYRDKMIDGRRVPFEFTILVRQQDSERLRNCELMRQCLELIHVHCTIQPIEATVLFTKLKNHDFQAYYGGWGTGADPDDDDNVWSTPAIDDGRNFLRYSNPEVDKLFVAGRKEFDRDKRAAIYAKIDELIFHDQPCTFLFWRNSYYGYNKSLRGYKFSPRGPYHYDPGFGSLWKAAQ